MLGTKFRISTAVNQKNTFENVGGPKFVRRYSAEKPELSEIRPWAGTA